MSILRAAAVAAVLALGAMGAAGALAQPFPDHVLKLVVPFAPGGATDVLGRILGKRMSEILGQPIVVENHPGAGGTVGTEFTARQPPDGYTLLLVNALPHTASRSLYPSLKYDPVRSFTPIGGLGTVRYMLIVGNEVPARDLREFVALARSQPGKLNFASAGMGSAPHLAMELFLRAAQVNMVHVPYAGSGPALTDIMGGRVQAIMENVPAIPLIKSGRVKALAITGKTRVDWNPAMPTFEEAGVGAFDVTGSWGLIGPAGIPESTVATLSNALSRAVSDPAVRETLLAQGIEPEYRNGSEYAAVMARELEKWSRLIEEARIRL